MTFVQDSLPESTKELLIRSSMKLFALRGYDGTTVKDIVDSAGVNISLVSYHFGGKEGLYRACINKYGKLNLDAAQRVLTRADSAQEFVFRFELFFKEILENMVQEAELSCIVHREFEINSDFVKDIIHHTFLKIAHCFIEFILQAQKKGFVRTEVDPTLFACNVFSVMVNISRMDAFNREYFNRTIFDPNYREQFVKESVDCFSKGILA